MFNNIAREREAYGYEELVLKYSILWHQINSKNIPYKIVYVPFPKSVLNLHYIPSHEIEIVEEKGQKISLYDKKFRVEKDFHVAEKAKNSFNSEVENLRVQKQFIENQILNNIFVGITDNKFITVEDLELFIFKQNKNIDMEKDQKIDSTTEMINYLKEDLRLMKTLKELNYFKELELSTEKRESLLDNSNYLRLKPEDRKIKNNSESDYLLDKEISNVEISALENRIIKKIEDSFIIEKDFLISSIFKDVINNFGEFNLIKYHNNGFKIEEYFNISENKSRFAIIDGREILIKTKEGTKIIDIEEQQFIKRLDDLLEVILESGEISSEVVEKYVDFGNQMDLSREKIYGNVYSELRSLVKNISEICKDDIEGLSKKEQKTFIQEMENFLNADENKVVKMIQDFIVEKVAEDIDIIKENSFLNKVDKNTMTEKFLELKKIQNEVLIDEIDIELLNEKVNQILIEFALLGEVDKSLELSIEMINTYIKQNSEQEIKEEIEIRCNKTEINELDFENEFFTKLKSENNIKIEEEEKLSDIGSTEARIYSDLGVTSKKKEQQLTLEKEYRSFSTVNTEISFEQEEKIKTPKKDLLIEVEKAVIKKEQERIYNEVEERLKLHGRFWMFRQYGEKTNLIIPNNDFNYLLLPLYFQPNDDNIRFKYKIEYPTPQNLLRLMFFIREEYYEFMIEEKNKVETSDYLILLENDKLVLYHNEIDYLFIGDERRYVIANSEETLSKENPFEGQFIGIRDIEVSLNIIIDFMNIFLLVWAKFYESYGGMTGTQSLKKFLGVFHEWVTLDGMTQEPLLEEYQRVYRWIRWEAEKIFNEAKSDVRLNGNFYIDKLLYNLLYYLEIHHYDTVPIYNKVGQIDEFFEIVDTENLPLVSTKFKTIHNRIKEE